MKLLNIAYKIYFALPNFGRFGLLGKALNRFLDVVILRKLFEYRIPKIFKHPTKEIGINTHKRDKCYIVSLTSFPARIDESWISLECLLRQSFKPDKIILWLAVEQFPQKVLPPKLLDMVERGVEIRFCDDLKSHKKYYYTMLEFPDAFIITFDDDLYYDNKVIENLVNLNKEFPNCIAANRAHQITFDKQNRIQPYRKWKHNVSNERPSHFLLHTSGAGTLFPPRKLISQTFDKLKMNSLSPNSDDVWLKVMAYLSNLKVVTNNRYNKDFVTVGSTQKESLVKNNTFKGGKDKQLSETMHFYHLDFSKNLEV